MRCVGRQEAKYPTLYYNRKTFISTILKVFFPQQHKVLFQAQIKIDNRTKAHEKLLWGESPKILIESSNYQNYSITDKDSRQ